MTQIFSSDESIIELMRHHDKRGLSSMYDKYAPALLGVIVRIVQFDEIAEEVLQDVFIKAWRNFENYNSEKGKLFTWLINISKNTAIDATRSKEYNRVKINIEAVTGIDVRYQTSYNPDIIDLRRLAEKLSPGQFELVDLIYFQGFTHIEAAEAIKIPLGTAKSRVRKAINLMRLLF